MIRTGLGSEGESLQPAMLWAMPNERPDPQLTINALLDASNREHLPLAKTFVQQRNAKGKGCPGPLSKFTAKHHERALRQYLLCHAVASGGDWGAAYPSQVWARGLRLDGTQLSARSAVSRNWAWLQKARLIHRGRVGRDAKITLLYDDGSGEPYCHPHHRKPRERFLTLPYAFWRQGWDAKLDLPGIAALLILLHEKPGYVPLVAERVPKWYGISTSTFEKGVQTLRRNDLLERRRDKVDAPLSDTGFTFVHRYRLLDAFERHEKKQGAGK
jgi:hypothetical protein